MTYFRFTSHGSLARSLIFSENPVALASPSRSNRSAEPVWTRGWPSQTRRRRPEKSVQTDQLGLQGECVLRRTARFLALPASARRRSFAAPRLHASTAQLSVRHTGMAERLRRGRVRHDARWSPAPFREARARRPSASASCRRHRNARAVRPRPSHSVQRVPTPPWTDARAGRQAAQASSSSISINRTERVYRGSAALRRWAVVGLFVGLAERRDRRRPVDKPGNRLCAPPDELRDVLPQNLSRRAAGAHGRAGAARVSCRRRRITCGSRRSHRAAGRGR